ncbi:hypothetical protein [Sulfuritalea sp.]|nr:hypothetical protein [Sulfuritalea sp.]
MKIQSQAFDFRGLARPMIGRLSRAGEIGTLLCELPVVAIVGARRT